MPHSTGDGSLFAKAVGNWAIAEGLAFTGANAHGDTLEQA